MYLQLLKLHNIVTNIDKHVSYLLKNANLILINKNANIFQQLFLYIPNCVIKIFFFLCWTLFQLLQK